MEKKLNNMLTVLQNDFQNRNYANQRYPKEPFNEPI